MTVGGPFPQNPPPAVKGAQVKIGLVFKLEK
jgi:hypothetical protein